MSTHAGELSVPDAAKFDPAGRELVRVWVAGETTHVALATDVWEDPGAWGILLVDLAHHVANAIEQTDGRQKAEVLQRIKQGFDAEWGHPTDDPEGWIEDP